MVNFTFDFSPSFKAVFYILWLAYPFLMILSGFILYLTIRHDHVFSIHSRRVSALIFLFSTLMAISSLITVVAWILHFNSGNFIFPDRSIFNYYINFW